MMIKKIKIVIILIFLAALGALFFNSSVAVEQNITTPPQAGTRVIKTILEINGSRYEGEILEPTSVYNFMNKLRTEQKIEFTEKNYVGMGKLIDSIDGIRSNGNKTWIYYVNGKKAEVGVSNYKLKPGDVVSWKYESLY